MIPKLQKLIVALIVTALLLPTTLLAQSSEKSEQTPGDWSVLATLTPGSEITITLKRGLTLRGNFASADEDFIFIKELAVVTFYHRVNVKSVSVTITRTKAEDTATVAGHGLAAGFKNSLEPKLKDDGRCCRYSSVGTTVKSAAAGAAIGGLLGLIFGGRSESRMIYEAK